MSSCLSDSDVGVGNKKVLLSFNDIVGLFVHIAMRAHKRNSNTLNELAWKLTHTQCATHKAFA